MPRARSQNQDDWQTAVASENGSGCLSFYVLPPLAVLLIAGFLAILGFNSPLSTSALPIAAHNSTMLLQTSAPPMENLIPATQAPAVVTQSLVSPTQIPAFSIDSAESTSSNWFFAIDDSSSSSGLSPIFTREVQHWGNDIIRWANAASLDPNLAAVVMQIESCGDPRATSRSGATSLFQVMPFHFHFGENPYNPETNALRGLNYLSRSLERAGGNPRLALAGYNGGIGVIGRSEWNWPAETTRYVYYGAPIYEDARNGVASSAMLNEWYQKYGAGLCSQAAQRLGLP